MIEIERKFTVKHIDFIPEDCVSYEIKQGYLNAHPSRTVRVRTKNEKAYLTIKGESCEHNLSRYEFEKEIPYADALELLKLCEGFAVEKTRFVVEYFNQTFEVDVFHGANEGLVIAEVELETTEERIDLPDWIAEEVTSDARYFNSYLAKNPYKKW